MALPHSPASPGWRRLVVFVALVALASAGCGHDGTGHGVATREVDTPPGPGPVPETIRLGIERMPAMGTMPGGGAPTAAAAPTWEVDLPARWRRLPPRPFRDVNLTVDGIEGVECYLTVTEAGSLADNVNRWRQQLGQDPLGEAELAALPREPLAGAEAAAIGLTGVLAGLVAALAFSDIALGMAGTGSLLLPSSSIFAALVSIALLLWMSGRDARPLTVILAGLALSTFADAGDAFRNMGGAVLMGIGGVLALGCTVGQAMTGFSTLAIGSIITFVAIVVGGVAGIKTMERFA